MMYTHHTVIVMNTHIISLYICVMKYTACVAVITLDPKQMDFAAASVHASLTTLIFLMYTFLLLLSGDLYKDILIL